MKLGCKLSSCSNPRSDQACQYLFFIFRLVKIKKQDYLRILDCSPATACDALHCRLQRLSLFTNREKSRWMAVMAHIFALFIVILGGFSKYLHKIYGASICIENAWGHRHWAYFMKIYWSERGGRGKFPQYR